KRPDAAAQPLPPAQLLGGQHRDVLDVRGPVDPVLLPRALPAADRRLLAFEERACDPAHDACDVRALKALWGLGRPSRAALLHGRGATDRRLWPAALPACGHQGRLCLRSAAGAARVLAWPRDDGGPS